MSQAQRNLLAWTGAAPGDLGRTMEAWRSSFPMLAAWDDAMVQGLVRIDPGTGRMAGTQVRLTPLGRGRLAAG